MIDFKTYHNQNLHLYRKILEVARQAKRLGFKQFSINSIYERIRWETAESGNDEYKLNNSYRADYARKIMEEHPLEFSGFFKIRELKTSRK